eukprot:4004120-Pleurochrysis_carterae.AAC.1
MFRSFATLLAAAAAAHNSSTGFQAASTKRRRVDLPSRLPVRSAPSAHSAFVGGRRASEGVSNGGVTSRLTVGVRKSA